MADRSPLNPAQLDRIVREVLRRLEASASSPAEVDEQRQTLVLGEAVVTLSALEGRLEKVKLVKVSTDAIVTPAVCDELRQRGISLARGVLSDALPARQLYAAGCRGPRWPLFLRLLAQTGAAASGHEFSGWREAADGACRAVEAGMRSVLWTEQPAPVVCHANRRAAVRATCAWDLSATREALRQLDPNLLVLDSRRHQPYELKRILQAYLDSPDVTLTTSSPSAAE